MLLALSVQQMWRDAVLFMLIAAFCLNLPAVYLHACQSLLFARSDTQVYMDFSTNFFFGTFNSVTTALLLVFFCENLLFFTVLFFLGFLFYFNRFGNCCESVRSI